MKAFVGMTKFFFLLFLISLFFVVTVPVYLFSGVFPISTKKLLTRIVSTFSSVMVLVLDIKINPINKKRLEENYFIVANHLSYLDMLILSTNFSTCYVTSIEMKNIPILGHITRLAGCLFVERRSRENLHNEIGEIQDALSRGFNVTVFPEATSTNGEQVLKFKRSLFEAAAKSNKKVLPLTINYRAINAEEMCINKRDLVCWYGDMSFLPHLFKLCFQDKIFVELNFSEEIPVETFEFNSGLIRDKAYELVKQNFYSMV